MTALPVYFPCTGVGSLPQLDPRSAVSEVLSRFREIPYWPQLPRRTPLEHMYPQFAAALPGASDLGEAGKDLGHRGAGVEVRQAPHARARKESRERGHALRAYP